MRVGLASIDITPGPDLGLVGYEERHRTFGARNDGVNDPLLARAVALEGADGTACLLLAVDQCLFSVAWARELREDLAAVAGLEVDRVRLAGTHTHSGPWTREPGLDDSLGRLMPDSLMAEGRAATDYRERLAEACRDVARRARADTFPCSQRWFEVPLGLGYRRRVTTSTGIEHCWNPAEQTHLHPEPQPDPSLSLLQLCEEGGERQVLLWSHGSHPVVLGKESNVVSADWPGAATRAIEAALPGARSVFVPGACGDTHPWLATQSDPAAVEVVGRAAAGLVILLAASGGEPTGTGELACRTATWTCGTAELDLAALRIAGGTVISAPVEAFSALSLRLRAALAGPVIFSTNTDGWTGYWPDRTAFAAGGYELKGAAHWGRAPGSGEALADRLIELALEAGARPRTG